MPKRYNYHLWPGKHPMDTGHAFREVVPPCAIAYKNGGAVCGFGPTGTEPLAILGYGLGKGKLRGPYSKKGDFATVGMAAKD